MFKAIVHDRKSGVLYYATCDIAHENVVTLFKPIYKNRLSRSIIKFKNGIHAMSVSMRTMVQSVMTWCSQSVPYLLSY